MKQKKMVIWLAAAMTVIVAGNTWSQTTIESSPTGWVREADASHAFYVADGISIWSSFGNDGARRYGLIEFDLSSLAGETIYGATLELYSAVHGYSDYGKPIKQSAFNIESSGVPMSSLTWNTYISDKDAGKAAFEEFGYYDLPAANTDPAQQDAFVPSEASVADLALIQAEVDGDGILSIVFIADELDEVDYAQSWGDGESGWSGGAAGNPKLTLFTEVGGGGPVINLSPSNGISNVSHDAVLDWKITPMLYNEPPTYTVYIDTDPDPNDGTIVNINDTNTTSYDPDLTFETTFWWRVDATDPNAGSPVTYKGETWSFKTVFAGTAVPSSNEIWIRAVGAHENDGIFVMNLTAGQRRYGLVEFDLSGFVSQSIISAHLQLYSAIAANTGKGALKQKAYVIDGSEGTALVDLDWDTYWTEKEPNQIDLEDLGAYDLPAFDSDASQQDTYVDSQASPADLSLVREAIDGDGLLSMVLIADEDGSAYERYWGDGVYGPAGPQPRLIIASGSAFNPTPEDTETDIDPSVVVLGWEVFSERNRSGLQA